jgi:hypothetical protein
MAGDPDLAIHHPEHMSKLKPVKYNDGGTDFWFLVVHGRRRGPGTLAATLKVGASTPPGVQTLTYDTLPGLHWCFVFTRLATSGSPVSYDITVTLDGGHAKTRRVTLDPTLAAPKLTYGSIPILYPTANSTVCPTFIASGQVVNSTPPNLCTMSSANYTANGMALPNPPNGLWLYQFTNVPNDSGYVFLVSNSTDQGSCGNITVDSVSCSQIQPPGPGP